MSLTVTCIGFVWELQAPTHRLLYLNICWRKSLTLDLIDIWKREFTSALLLRLDHALLLSYSKIANQSDCLKHQDHREYTVNTRTLFIIVLPRNQLDKSWVQLNSGQGIKNWGVCITDEVGGNNLVLSVSKESLQISLRCFLHNLFYLLIRSLSKELTEKNSVTEIYISLFFWSISVGWKCDCLVRRLLLVLLFAIQTTIQFSTP